MTQSNKWQGSARRDRLPANWSTIRKRVLARDPICKICGIRPSTVCDHKVAMADDHRETALQGICKPCDKAKSSSEGHAGMAARRAEAKYEVEPHPGLL